MPKVTMLAPYRKIIAISARENAVNTQRLITGIVVSIVRVGLLAAIYRVAYHAVSNAPLSYENAVWSMGVYFAFMLNLNLRGMFRMVDDEVRTGSVEVILIKPVEWRLSKLCQLLGKSGLEFIVQLSVLPAVLLILVGKPDISHLTWPVIVAFILLTALAMITAIAMFTAVGLSAFWLSDASSVFQIVDKSALIFGGGFVPIALLPHTVQLFVRLSPFGVYAAPTQLFNPHIVSVLPAILLAAAVWSGLMVLLCEVIWRRAARRIEVNGG